MIQQEENNNIINDYINGLGIDNLIKKYHHDYYYIKDILIKNGIKLRTISESIKGKLKSKTTPEIEQEIIKYYLAGNGLKSTGAKFGYGPYVTRNILVKNNIPIRNFSQSAILSNINRKKFFCNINYFKNQSANMAYILGFLAADGYIGLNNNEIKITLAEKDSELLQKIKNELEYTGEVKHSTTSKGFDIATLEITCSEYKKDLAQYNIVPQKTFTFSIPNSLQKEYYIDFIRGYWDGDGTICTAGKSAIRASLCSAQKITLQQILDFLEKEYNIPKVTIQERIGKNTLYYIQYSSISTRKLFKAMYYKKDLLYLDRKYKKFCELCIDNKYPRDSIS